MAYADRNFKTKKALKEAVAKGESIMVYSPGPYPVKENGRTTIEGPWYPAPHTWYASVEIENGYIKKVIS